MSFNVFENNFKNLQQHASHNLHVCVSSGSDGVDNAAIVCKDCAEILFDFDKKQQESDKFWCLPYLMGQVAGMLCNKEWTEPLKKKGVTQEQIDNALNWLGVIAGSFYQMDENIEGGEPYEGEN